MSHSSFEKYVIIVNDKEPYHMHKDKGTDLFNYIVCGVITQDCTH